MASRTPEASGAYGDGVHPDRTAILSAMADMGQVGAIILENDYLIDANLTIPLGIELIFRGGNIIASSSSIELTINGPSSIPKKKVFHGFGSGKVLFDVGYSNAVPRDTCPEWWGPDAYGNFDQAFENARLAGTTVHATGQYPLAVGLVHAGGSISANKHLYCHPGSVFLAAANNIVLLKWSASYGSLKGRVMFNANGHTGGWGLAIVPENMASTTVLANQNYNDLDADIYGTGLDELVVFQAGPAVNVDGTMTASGCWYNMLRGRIRGTSCKRDVWFKDGGWTNAVASGPNSNQLPYITCGGTTNTAVQMDAGGGNVIRGDIENVTHGTSPNTTPTAFVIKDSMANGGDNPNNQVCLHVENVTRHAVIDEPLTNIAGSDFDFSLVTGTAAGKVSNDGARLGTFNGALSADSGSISAASYKKFSYVKRGKLVFISGYIQVSAISGAAGRLYLSGCPFTVAPGTESRVSLSIWSNLLITTPFPTMARMQEGSSAIEIAKHGSVGNMADQVPQFADFTISGTFITND